MRARIWAVIPAGGVGSRMHRTTPKQYLMLGGMSVIEHTLARLSQLDSVARIMLGVSKFDSHWSRLNYHHVKLAGVVEAGAERVDTVENCLQQIIAQGGEQDWALVHDAARPCVRAGDIQTLIDCVIETRQGAILAVPLSDTIKRGSATSGVASIEQTVPRENLWRAMTPQMFKVGALLSAIQYARKAGVELTDEASAMEATGGAPLLIPCAPDNIKITLPQDIAMAETILLAQDKEKVAPHAGVPSDL